MTTNLLTRDYLGMLTSVTVHLADGRTVTAGDIDGKRLRSYAEGIQKMFMRRDRIVWALRFLKVVLAKEFLNVIREELAAQRNPNRDPNVHCFETWTGSPPSERQPDLEDVIRKMSWLDLRWIPDIDNRPLTVVVYRMLTDTSIRYHDEMGDAYPSHLKHAIEMLRQFCLVNPMVDAKGNPVLSGGVPRMRSALAPHHPLNTTVWDRQSFYEIQDLVKRQCDDLSDQFRGFTEEMGHKVLEIGRFAWFDLERGYSREEGSAMGHCGNISGQSDKSQTILSYRESGDSKGWKPHLTFILHKDSSGRTWLGEMKGKKNSKPLDKWHHPIVELLKLPLVNEVRGGGYLTAANFCLFHVRGFMDSPMNGWTDLSIDLATDLHESRPEIWLHNGVCQFCYHTVPDFQKTGERCLREESRSVSGSR